MILLFNIPVSVLLINDPVSFIALIFLVIVLTLAQMRQNVFQQAKISLKKVQRRYQIRNSFRVHDEEGDRVYYVENLIITPAGLYLVHMEDRTGKITGTEEDEIWTDTGKRKSEEFENPLILLKHLKEIVQEQIDSIKKGVPITPLVVFSIKASIIDLEATSPIVKGPEIANFLMDEEKQLESPILTKTDMSVLYGELRPNLYKDKKSEE